jgi:hypothetical protein
MNVHLEWGKRRNTYRILEGTVLKKQPLERMRLEGNNKINLE